MKKRLLILFMVLGLTLNINGETPPPDEDQEEYDVDYASIDENSDTDVEETVGDEVGCSLILL